LNRTKIRFVAGLKSTLPDPPTNTPNVGVAFAAICIVTVSVGGAKHNPLAGSVAQIEMPTGSWTPPVSGEAAMTPAAPTLGPAEAMFAAPSSAYVP